jgi:hypothetical protein
MMRETHPTGVVHGQPTPPYPRLTVHSSDGEVVAHYIPDGDVRALHAALESLRDQIARGEADRAHDVAELTRLADLLLPAWTRLSAQQRVTPDTGDQPDLIINSRKG